MKLIKAPQYSVWWKPEGELLAQVQKVIDTLGNEFWASEYGAETFVPHITVVPDIILGKHFMGDLTGLVEAVKDMARGLPAPASLKAKEIDKGDSFFQCVFARAELTEVMKQTVEEARKRFRPDLFETRAIFMPHMSLLYGDFSQDVRDRAIVRAKELLALPIIFGGKKISLWTSGVPAREWQMVEEFEVGN